MLVINEEIKRKIQKTMFEFFMLKELEMER
jgi:hypothetical protein